MDVKNLASYEPVEYTGSIKLHGTSSAFCYDIDTGEYWIQSRERILTLNQDNAGFFVFCEQHKGQLIDLCKSVANKGQVIIYGEFIGPGIQKSVAINQLPKKMFYIFAIRIDGKFTSDDVLLSVGDYINMIGDDSKIRVVICDVSPVNITIDFMRASDYTEQLEKFALDVEAECPIGKFHGVSGIGEGLVFTPVNVDKRNIPELWFKVKGEKHSVSKVQVGAKVTAVDLASIKEACEALCTENRLNQGLSYLKEMGMTTESKHTGDFIKWVMGDILKEDSDILTQSGIEWKSVQGHLAKRLENSLLINRFN